MANDSSSHSSSGARTATLSDCHVTVNMVETHGWRIRSLAFNPSCAAWTVARSSADSVVLSPRPGYGRTYCSNLCSNLGAAACRCVPVDAGHSRGVVGWPTGLEPATFGATTGLTPA